jgi:hypothetical protein
MMKKMVVATLIISLLSPMVVHAEAEISLAMSPASAIMQAGDNTHSTQRTPNITYVLERINQDRILTAQKQIARDMYINKWTRYTLRGASAALMIGAGYIILKWFLDKKSISVETASTSAVAPTVDMSSILTNEEIKKRFNEYDQQFIIYEQLFNKPSAAFFSFEYLKKTATSIRDYGVYLVLAPLAVSRTNAAIDRVFVNRDIEWFVIQQTSLANQLQAAKYSAQAYTDEKAQDYHNYVLLDVYSRIVKQIEMVLAFMYYTRDTLPQTHIELKNLDFMISYLRNCTDDMCLLIEQFLNKKNEPKDKNQLEAIVTRFETEVHNTINRFKDVAQDILNENG